MCYKFSYIKTFILYTVPGYNYINETRLDRKDKRNTKGHFFM
jgi:hypothetical protein